MNADVVKGLFRAYIDEPDGTFVTSADINLYLDRGYDEFRLRVNNYDSDFYAVDIDISVTANNEYDLSSTGTEAVTLVGPAPSVGASAAMIRLNMVRATSTSGSGRGFIYRAVSGMRALDSAYQSWAMQNTKLLLSEVTSGTLRLSYIPVASVGWDVAGEFIDSLGPFHDLIALYAYKQYAIRDNADNGPLRIQTEIRERDFKGYLSQHNHETNQYVNQVWNS
tara:strand:+ start:9514 stop:10182 length:669 start_codon:yes stop_codon:yes gene_type:complete